MSKKLVLGLAAAGIGAYVWHQHSRNKKDVERCVTLSTDTREMGVWLADYDEADRHPDYAGNLFVEHLSKQSNCFPGAVEFIAVTNMDGDVKKTSRADFEKQLNASAWGVRDTRPAR